MILKVDGHGGYRVLADKSSVTLTFCRTHVRRRFYELAAAGPRRLPAKRSYELAVSTRSRVTSVAGRPTSAVLRVMKRAARSSSILSSGCAKRSA